MVVVELLWLFIILLSVCVVWMYTTVAQLMYSRFLTVVNLERSAMQAIDFRARLKHTRKEYLKSMYEEFGKKG